MIEEEFTSSKDLPNIFNYLVYDEKLSIFLPVLNINYDQVINAMILM